MAQMFRRRRQGPRLRGVNAVRVAGRTGATRPASIRERIGNTLWRTSGIQVDAAVNSSRERGARLDTRPRTFTADPCPSGPRRGTRGASSQHPTCRRTRRAVRAR